MHRLTECRWEQRCRRSTCVQMEVCESPGLVLGDWPSWWSYLTWAWPASSEQSPGTHGKQKSEHRWGLKAYHTYFCIHNVSHAFLLHYVLCTTHTLCKNSFFLPLLTSSVFLLRISSCCLFWASSNFSWCCNTITVSTTVKETNIVITADRSKRGCRGHPRH